MLRISIARLSVLFVSFMVSQRMWNARRSRVYGFASMREFTDFHACAARHLRTVLTCACLLLLLFATSIRAASVRGVQPSLVSAYNTEIDSFKCLDGSKLLPSSRVNDDYCDCLDGSDEPG